MSDEIAAKIASLRGYFDEHPDRAVAADSSAVATMGANLRCEVRGPHDAAVVTAMPKGLGGDGSAPTPGWYLRSAIASCAATSIAMRAAELGVRLDSLEVQVDSTSDGRGLLRSADARPGLLEAHMTVSVSAPGSPPELVEQLIREADLGSPVGESLRNSVSLTTTVHHLPALA